MFYPLILIKKNFLRTKFFQIRNISWKIVQKLKNILKTYRKMLKTSKLRQIHYP